MSLYDLFRYTAKYDEDTWKDYSNAAIRCKHKIGNVSLFFIINACIHCGLSEEEIQNEYTR